MKRKLIFLIGIFFIFLIIIAIRFFFVKFTHKQGSIKVLSSPISNVIIDEAAKGKTPFESSLTEGEYFLKLIPDESEASESAGWSGKVKIYNNTLTFVSRELGSSDTTSSGVIFTITNIPQKKYKSGTGQIELKTEPDGSIIYLDNEEQGIAPVILSDIPEGDHEISVYTPGFFRRSQKIRIKAGYRVIAEFKLAIDPSHKKIEPDKEKGATESAQTSEEPKNFMIEILTTDTGWLRVRVEPSLSASEAAKVKPGEKYTVLEEKEGWYKINYSENNQGWISANYAKKAEVAEPSPSPSR
ncbi:hypothetical protein A2957_01020 [Candidatus Roizmanbacteria bacterium RIFCSPLOWO2_01_FULL_38_11]|uniref:SH3b domain-containing protein n=1 Tax=Candidatus Roizmanbacteria bacterium RIFCSPLOWO2_01_FULL_38_11 TaxID=1802060 RepID=A0A1F7IN60_9BACT|nr:MAG: hypothetical protein A2957_01020 [Candidatus Roizmanbacteria bacterium RIFCSPLOWO2_01_FULL_38_11]